MIARILDPKSGQPFLVCGPNWSAQCGAAGGAAIAACAGRDVDLEQRLPDGSVFVSRAKISARQGICPFAAREVPGS